ncbi:metal-dependent hydrolase [Candidatus Woesearchaeota archaeon]|nr:metal-dependent hydrolase [Candidatus Woesearchaeota archaeon]
MTAPTHIAGSISLLLMSAVVLRCFSVEWIYVLFTMLSSLVCDFDNPKSYAGWLFRNFILMITFGKVDVSRILEHRGFFHSLPFCLMVCGIVYAVAPTFAPYVFIGIMSHIILDTFQSRGVRLLGFGNSWARFSTNWAIPLRSAGEYSFLASCILVILVCSLILHKGGTNHLIRKALGTLKASSEDINDLQEFEKFLVVADGNSAKEYFVLDSLGNDSIIVRDGNVPLAYGYKKDCHIKASGKSFVKKGGKVSVLNYRFVMRDVPLRHLYSRIDLSYFYYFSGKALLYSPIEIPSFHNRYNTISGSGRKYSFEFASLDDLKIYGIEDSVVEVGDFEVVYRVYEGQHPPSLEQKIESKVSDDVLSCEKRISELKRLIDGGDAKTEAVKIFRVSSDEAETYSKVLIKQAKELLRREEENLLRLRNMRN